ncbi:hypothetical protein D3C80_1474860 [compost metagenome]
MAKTLIIKYTNDLDDLLRYSSLDCVEFISFDPEDFVFVPHNSTVCEKVCLLFSQFMNHKLGFARDYDQGSHWLTDCGGVTVFLEGLEISKFVTELGELLENAVWAYTLPDFQVGLLHKLL